MEYWNWSHWNGVIHWSDSVSTSGRGCRLSCGSMLMDAFMGGCEILGP